jgi:hypothetical protein
MRKICTFFYILTLLFLSPAAKGATLHYSFPAAKGATPLYSSPVAKGASEDGCLLSVDIFFIEDSCIISGIKVRYGEYYPVWHLQTEKNNREGTYSAVVYPVYDYFPLALASKPKYYKYLNLQPLIELSPMSTWESEEIDEDEGSGRMDFYAPDFMTEETEDMYYSSDKPVRYFGRLTYEYYSVGFYISTPYRLFKLGIGYGLSWQKTNFQFFICSNCDDYKTEIYNLKEEYFGGVAMYGLSVWEGENLSILTWRVSFRSWPVLIHDIQTSNGIGTDVTWAERSIEFISWSFHF